MIIYNFYDFGFGNFSPNNNFVWLCSPNNQSVWLIKVASPLSFSVAHKSTFKKPPPLVKNLFFNIIKTFEKRKGCLVFLNTQIELIIILANGDGTHLPTALPSLGVILELQGIL